MNSKTLALLVILVFTGFSLTLMGSFETEEKLSIPSEGIEKLFVDCGAGFLKIEGVEKMDKIEVRAEIKVSNADSRDEAMDKGVILSLEKKGNKAVLVSKIKRKLINFGTNYINLTVRIPKKMELDIDDGSGSIEIANTDGDIKLDDGSGSMTITGVTGSMKIVDGSGTITIDDIRGNLKIKDGSGSTKIYAVKGNLILDDGSGSISIKDIKGDVNIEDSSGPMEIVDIDGSVTVNDGSGNVTINGVTKNVTIIDDGSGSLKIKNVKGKVKK